MSATILLHPAHPATRKLSATTGWEQSMESAGADTYVPRQVLADFFDRILELHAKETARTNANIFKRPRYRNQFCGVRLGDEPPPSAA